MRADACPLAVDLSHVISRAMPCAVCACDSPGQSKGTLEMIFLYACLSNCDAIERNKKHARGMLFEAF